MQLRQEAAQAVAAERRTPAVVASMSAVALVPVAEPISAVAFALAAARISAAALVPAAFALAAGRISAARGTSVAAPVSAAQLTPAAGLRYRGPRGGQVSALNARRPLTAVQTGPSAARLCRTQTEAPL